MHRIASRLFIWIICTAFAMAGFSVNTLAQESQDQPQEPPAEEQGFRIGVAVDQVFLSVSTRSTGGGFVKNLTREDVLIFEDGIPQKVENFYSEQVPVKVVLLVDASGSTASAQAQIQNAALEFVKRLGGEDEVAVITFNHEIRQLLDWTNDPDKVENAMKRIYARGNTVLNDAIYVTFDELLRDVEGKTAVIVLTDGGDTGSTVSFSQAIDRAARSESVVYIVSKLEEAWASAIAFRSNSANMTRFGGITPRELSDDYMLEMRRNLKRLADLTGGRVLNAASFNSIVDVYAQVAEELKNQYYISYVSTNKRKDGKWRNLEVRSRSLGTVLRTRQGYYAN
ncbi:MAG: VWA domain-containing protein [Acidobacteriota bacterium]